jgi:hypothetical protein
MGHAKLISGPMLKLPFRTSHIINHIQIEPNSPEQNAVKDRPF